MPGLQSNDARGLRGAIAADERPAERDRDFPENLARDAPADRALDAVEPLGDFDLARDHGEQCALFTLVYRVLSDCKVDVRGSARQMLELLRRQVREERNGCEFFGS